MWQPAIYVELQPAQLGGNNNDNLPQRLLISLVIPSHLLSSTKTGVVYSTDWTRWTGLDSITKLRTSGPDYITCSHPHHVCSCSVFGGLHVLSPANVLELTHVEFRVELRCQAVNLVTVVIQSPAFLTLFRLSRLFHVAKQRCWPLREFWNFFQLASNPNRTISVPPSQPKGGEVYLYVPESSTHTGR